MKTLSIQKIVRQGLRLLMVLLPVALHAQGSWSTEPSEGFTGGYGVASAVVDGKIFVMGGQLGGSDLLNDFQAYDPTTKQWSTPTTTGTFTARRQLSAAAVNGKIYALGGEAGTTNGPGLNTLEVFDPGTNTWSTPATSGMFSQRRGLSTAVVEGKIYAIGGIDGALMVNSLEVFDPATNTWSTPATTGTFTARRGAAASVVDGKIYVFGGSDAQAAAVNILEVFDPATNSWSTPSTTGAFTARRGHGSSVVDGKIYVTGGFTATEFSNAFEVFDPATNTWSTPSTTGSLTPRQGLVSNTVNGKIYVMAGSSASQWNVNEVYTPATSSVHSNAVASDLRLFPNPTNGVITVHWPTVDISHIAITNVIGDIVMKGVKDAASDITIDISHLSRGVYIVKLMRTGSSMTQIVVKN